MFKLNRHELSLVRLEVAVGLCVRFPALYRRITEHLPTYCSIDEQLAGVVLKSLMNVEPCVRYTLSYYYKREMR
jgi:hypothetical protein